MKKKQKQKQKQKKKKNKFENLKTKKILKLDTYWRITLVALR